MRNFKFIKTPIQGLFVIEPELFQDQRGYFMESYHFQKFSENGLTMQFVQDNQSLSKKGVLRGLHFQKEKPQGKLVRVLKGEVFDVAVDIRKDSQTYLQWFGITLSDKNKKQLYIPEGFAHGFLVLSDEAELYYKCTNFYESNDQHGIMWNDPEIAIDWPIDNIDFPVLSENDNKWPLVKDLRDTND